MLPVLVINRLTDSERLNEFNDSARLNGINPIRIAAIDAHRTDFASALFADLIGPTFWGEPDAKPGAIGCFLSHRRAWQYIVDRGLQACVIAEDDARFSNGLDGLAAAFTRLSAPDLIFANGRLSAWASATDGSSDTVPLHDVVAGLAAAGGPETLGLTSAPGGDCYVLSLNGAQRLLALTDEQRIQCGVDWAMVWNGLASLPVNPGDAFPELKILEGLLALPPEPLRAHVLRKPIADQAKGPSTLRHAVTRPIADLTASEPVLAHAEFISEIRLGGARLCFAGRSGPDPVMEAHRFGRLWDQAGLRLLLERFPEGGTFVDIGAHLGNHSVAMGRLGGAATIIAADANGEILRLLHMNLAINGLGSRANVSHTAIGSAEATAWLLRNRKRSSESMVKMSVPREDQEKAERIAMITGDTLIDGRHVDAIKIDTGGTEVDVLRGLTDTLKVQTPLLLIDHAAGAGDRIARVGGQLGYRVAETVAAGRRKRETALLVSEP